MFKWNVQWLYLNTFYSPKGHLGHILNAQGTLQRQSQLDKPLFELHQEKFIKPLQVGRRSESLLFKVLYLHQKQYNKHYLTTYQGYYSIQCEHIGICTQNPTLVEQCHYQKFIRLLVHRKISFLFLSCHTSDTAKKVSGTVSVPAGFKPTCVRSKIVDLNVHKFKGLWETMKKQHKAAQKTCLCLLKLFFLPHWFHSIPMSAILLIPSL